MNDYAKVFVSVNTKKVMPTVSKELVIEFLESIRNTYWIKISWVNWVLLCHTVTTTHLKVLNGQTSLISLSSLFPHALS